MQIKYKLTEDDYVHFNMFHVKNSKLAVSKYKRQRFLIPLLALIVAYVFADAVNISIEGTLFFILVIGILWVIFYPKMYSTFIIRNAMGMVSRGQINNILGQHTMVLSKEGMVDSAPKGKSEAKWANVYNFKEDNDYFYIYISKISAVIIPKRDIKNPQEISTFIKSKVTIKDEVTNLQMIRFLLRKNG
jgi:hypothetical protein